MVTTEAPGGAASAAPGRRSFVDTWTEVAADAGGLIRAEAAMARLETGENLRGFAGDAARIGAGALLISVTIVLLAVAAVVALAHLVGMLAALLIVAGICAVAGWLLVRSGKEAISTRRLLPERSLSRMSRDLERLSAQGAPLPMEETASAETERP
ncbi:phage holin family protein [Sandaracinobacter sp. RS1-74]|uniref:phage holin family protein n=1 Tax=Sandaracinobacteroides sayramensis TaxID=2913411 RepID=UPI001EDBB059|nr:phage holin family protein [Sandaracinobacteroides sayramensis]MCG2841340.1 phage holin family protein [Sandaracinobacteroides sayramensis]